MKKRTATLNLFWYFIALPKFPSLLCSGTFGFCAALACVSDCQENLGIDRVRGNRRRTRTKPRAVPLRAALKLARKFLAVFFFSLSFSSFENFPPILVASFFSLLVSSSLELVLFSHLYLFAFFFLFLLRPSLSLSVGRVYFIVLALQGGGRLSLREKQKK